MIENEFLKAVRGYLGGAGLTPLPATIGIAEPADAGDLPAIVLSLEGVRRLSTGLGERDRLIQNGVLQWTANIELTNPVLPEEPTFSLLSPDRKQLTLPHGGLVRADGTEGALGPADLSVSVAGADRPVVAGPPADNQVSADPLVGRLLFATALPGAGLVVARYFLGQWERRVARMDGNLRALVRAADASQVEELSANVVDALQPPGSTTIGGLHGFSALSLGTIGPPDRQFFNSRSRVLVFSFQYELVIDRPDSSGGVIQRVTIDAST